MTSPNNILTQTPATSLNGTEEIWAIQASADVRLTTGQIVALAAGKVTSTPFPVSIGGTGAITLTANDLLIGNGASPIAGTATGAGVLTALGNTANAASGLVTLTAGGVITQSQITTNAGSQKTVASPAFPSSTSAFLMQGLAGSITPATTGNVVITISGTINAATATTVDNGVIYQLSYGTGAAPTSNTALAGTQIGVVQTYTSAVAPTAVGDVNVPFSVSYRVTGLTLATAYWIDLAAEAVTTASDMGFVNVMIVAMEH